MFYTATSGPAARSLRECAVDGFLAVQEGRLSFEELHTLQCKLNTDPAFRSAWHTAARAFAESDAAAGWRRPAILVLAWLHAVFHATGFHAVRRRPRRQR